MKATEVSAYLRRWVSRESLRGASGVEGGRFTHSPPTRMSRCLFLHQYSSFRLSGRRRTHSVFRQLPRNTVRSVHHLPARDKGARTSRQNSRNRAQIQRRRKSHDHHGHNHQPKLPIMLLLHLLTGIRFERRGRAIGVGFDGRGRDERGFGCGEILLCIIGWKSSSWSSFSPHLDPSAFPLQ